MAKADWRAGATALLAGALLYACTLASVTSDLDADNPIRPDLPSPYGMEEFFAAADRQPEPARVRLGRWLFFDQRLSADHSVSCATCHRPEHGFSQPVALPTGVGGRRGLRKAPSLINLGARTILPDGDAGPAFFWDGRAPSLEAQVLMPIADPNEMGSTHATMVATLSGIDGYRRYFREAFGTDAITESNVAAALADYVRSRKSGNAPYDQWAYGKNGRALSAEQQQGSDIFFFRGSCATCHAGFNFSDGRFHNLGVGWNAATQTFADEGRAAVSHDQRDRGKFKTPGLRDVATHAPYMHDGSLPTLRAVVEFYNRGGIANPWKSGRVRPLTLTPDEIDALVAFLESLNGEGYQDTPPRHFPR